MMTTLTDMEIAVIVGDMTHSPNCIWSEGGQFSYRDEQGNRWADAERTTPYVDPVCTCGYFAHLENARTKLRAVSLGNRES